MHLVDAARSTPGRVAAVIAGVGGVALIVHGLGIGVVAEALAGCAPYFALVVMLEVFILVCTTMSLRALYGVRARRVPARQLARAALVGYAAQGIVPPGRAAAEAARASLLSRWVGVGFARAAAARMQAIVLVANGLVSVAAAVAATVALGASWVPLALALYAGVTLSLGVALLIVLRGAWLGRR
jgi:hypothetical protein